MMDKRLWREARIADGLLVLTVGLGVGLGLLVVLQARYLSQVVNRVFLEGQDLKGVWSQLLALLGVIFLRAGLSWLSEVTAHGAAVRIKHGIRERLLAHLFALGPVYVRGEQTGELVNLLTEGTEALEVYFSRYLPQLAQATLIPLLFLGFVFPLDLLSGLILLGTAPLIPLFMILIGRRAEAVSRRQWDVLSRMNAHFLDVLRGLTTLKLFGCSVAQGEVVSLVSNRFRQTTLEVLREAFLSALVLELLATLSTAMVAVALGLRLVYDRISFEEAFFLLLLVPEFYLPLRLLGGQFHAGLSAVSAGMRIFQVLDQPLPQGQVQNAKDLPPNPRLHISFEEVSYSYDEGVRPVLRDVSFELFPGERVALVGISGAGKSTIAHLLLRFIEPTGGKILVNGIPLDDLSPEEWRRYVALVPQNPYLFYGTVSENISLGRPQASLDEVMAAARLAGAHEFILRLPQGYHTPVGDGGMGLSGGQAQRLVIARAFLQDAPFLILDEATAGLDPEREWEVQKALESLMKGRTVLVIAHRLSTVYQADRILVLEEGRVVESGRHEELMGRWGTYYRLVAAGGGVG